MNDTLSLPAPAKLNLFLHITGRRADGYHTLQTLFQFLDFSDTLNFRLTQGAEIKVTPALPGFAPETNLISRAAVALRRASGRPTPGVSVQLDKRIPMGGGLGGGSSDAATTLLALNRLWELNLETEELAAIGLELGADVPVFVRGHAAWAEGIGDVITPAEPAEDWYLVLAPDCNISTAEIFQHERLTRNSKRIRIAPAFDGNRSELRSDGSELSSDCSEPGSASPELRNDCEELVSSLYPPVKHSMAWLREQSGNARLTGTGACIFSRFPTESGARAVLNKKPSGIKGFVAKGLNNSPLHKRLYELF